MGKITEIAWCDHSWSGWWGCTRVSPGCINCYAEVLAKRFGHNVWGPTTDRRFFGNKHWTELAMWNRGAEQLGHRETVFVGSMMDLFEDRTDLIAPRRDIFSIMEECHSLTFLCLTKRSENVHKMVPPQWLDYGFPENICLGVSIESQKYVSRIEDISELTCLKFVSAEPMLESIRFDPFYWGIDWVIAGLESGPYRRDGEVSWIQDLREICDDRNVPFFCKQDNGIKSGMQGRIPDDLWSVKQFPVW